MRDETLAEGQTADGGNGSSTITCMPDEHATATGTPRTGWTRPVAVPADIDDSRLDKASGVIELPPHVSWSGPPIQWDLGRRASADPGL